MVESHKQLAQESEKQQSRKRYDHLREIELKMNEVHLSSRVAESQHTEGYEQ